MPSQAEKLHQVRPYPAPPARLRGDPIGGERYWSRQFMDLEWQHLWPRVWHIGGRVAQLPEPGDFITVELGRESILMVRTDSGAIKAFYNVCPHRGNRLVHAEEGSLEQFICAYHSWTYDKDGVLRDVQDPDDFPQGNPCGKLKLSEVSCDIWGGFVWFNMDANAVPLREWLSPLSDYLEAYQPESQVRVLWMTVEVPCNWKVIHDNFNESYHLPTLHPELATFIEEDYKQTQFDLYPSGHNRMIQMGGLPSRRLTNQSDPQAPLDDLLRFWDLDPGDFRGRAREARLALQQQKRKLGPARGYDHFETMTDDQLTDYNHCTFFPNFSLTFAPDGFQLLRPNPHPTDPEKCLFDHWYMVPEVSSMEKVETPLGLVPIEPGEHQTFKYQDRSAGYVADQDLSIVVGQQKGLASRAFADAYLTGQETRVRRYHEMINDYIEGRR